MPPKEERFFWLAKAPSLSPEEYSHKTLTEVVDYLSKHSKCPDDMWGVVGTLSITQDDGTTAYGLFGMTYEHVDRIIIPWNPRDWGSRGLTIIPPHDELTTQENTIRLFVSNQVKDNIQPFDTFQAQYASAYLSIGVPSMHVAGSEATSSNIQLTVHYAGKYYNSELEQKGPYLTGLGDALQTYPDFHQFGPYGVHSQLAQHTLSFWDYIDYSRRPHPHDPFSDQYFLPQQTQD